MVSTLEPPSALATRAPAGDAPVSRLDLRLVSVLVVLLVVFQRLGVDAGGSVISVALPLGYAFAALLLIRRALVVSRLRAVLLAVGLAACLLATAAVSWRGGQANQFSLPSLWLLIAVYLPWVLCARDGQGAVLVSQAGRTFVRTMLVVAVAGMAQLAAQLAGVWDWTDYLQELVGDEFIVADYNFDNELAYDVGVFKSTGFVLLEPSFLSQFCALAIIIGIMLRARAWQLLVLVGGLASAVSGTGLILLGAGAALLLLRVPRRIRLGHVLVGAAVPVILFYSPVGSFLLQRQGELTTEGTSGNARFVAPYEAAWNGLLADPVRFLVGAGPGSVDRVIPGSRVGFNGTDILYSIVPKLAFEYGIVAGGLIILFLVLATLDRAPWRVVPGALLVMVFVLSGALLQPQTAFLVWLLAGIGAASNGRRAAINRPAPGLLAR